MNRSEYLMALYDALDGLPSQDRVDVITEYKEYFRIETEKGRTEEEICLSLGDPVTLAYAIKQRRGYDPIKIYDEEPPRRQPMFRKIKSVIALIVILCIFVGGTIMFSFSKESGLIVGAGKKYEINDIRSIGLESAKTIIIKADNANTSILPSDQSAIKSSLVGNVRSTSPDHIPKLEVTRSGDTIIIEEKRPTFGVIGFYWESLNLDISIPKSFQGVIEFKGSASNFKASGLVLDDFSLKLSSGNVHLDNMTANKNMKLASGSGDIIVNGLKANSLNIQSSSGNKKLSDVEIKENFNINSGSGKTILSDVSCHKLGIDSISGEIDIEGLKLDRISIKTVSGNVNVRNLEGDAQIESSSGKVSVSVKEAEDEIYIKASSGDVELRMPSNTGFTLDGRTSSGNIRCDFDLDNKVSDDKTLKGSYLKGDIKLNLKTSSGKIYVKKS